MSVSNPLLALQNGVSNVDRDSFTTEEDRREALAAARSLCHRLEKPMESMLRIAWIEPAYAACLKVALDIGLFTALETGKDGVENGDGGIGGREDRVGYTTEELAASTKTDPKLLERILRLLASMETVSEVGEGRFSTTQLSKSLTERRINSAIDYRYLFASPAFQGLPGFLKEKSYQNPSNLLDSPLQYGMQTKLSFFDWVGSDSKVLEMFTNHMAGYTSQRGTWEDVYPIRERLLGEDEDLENVKDVILADLGGGAGHDLQRFASNFMPASNKPCLILQDLPEVIDQIKGGEGLSPTIKAIPIDLTKSSPVSGSRGYFMHSVLHDWPDTEVHKILTKMHETLAQQTPDGRTPKLLLNENVLPKRGVQLQPAALDLIMMAAFASNERSEEQWTTLLESAGYKITGIFSKIGVDESVIEAEAVAPSGRS